MTEAAWLESDSPEQMLLDLPPRALSARKLRLYACACVATVWRHTGEDAPPALAVAERYAEGQATLEELFSVRNGNWTPQAPRNARDITRAMLLRAAATATTSPSAWSAAVNAANAAARIAGQAPRSCRVLADLLRDVGGRPFHPPLVVPGAWLSWNEGTVRKLATLIDEDRSFEWLPILADALEEAGCDDAGMLQHCRGPGPHVRGCWVIDLLLDMT